MTSTIFVTLLGVAEAAPQSRVLIRAKRSTNLAAR
jgi:hypothetical protein